MKARDFLLREGYSAEQVDKFIQYHTTNKQVWKEFERLAISLIASGVRHYGAGALQEVIRFNAAVAGNDGFKINNNYRPFYARIFAAKYPEHKDFFETREVRENGKT